MTNLFRADRVLETGTASRAVRPARASIEADRKPVSALLAAVGAVAARVRNFLENR